MKVNLNKEQRNVLVDVNNLTSHQLKVLVEKGIIMNEYELLGKTFSNNECDDYIEELKRNYVLFLSYVEDIKVRYDSGFIGAYATLKERINNIYGNVINEIKINL